MLKHIYMLDRRFDTSQKHCLFCPGNIRLATCQACHHAIRFTEAATGKISQVDHSAKLESYCLIKQSLIGTEFMWATEE